jgi:hypothetical protein
MRKSELEKMLGPRDNNRKKGYGKYYAAISGTFATGNAMAYLAYGMHGLFDAIGIDFITLGFTLYEQLKMTQENEKIDHYIEELHDIQMEDKIALISLGGSNTSHEKASKIGYIAYQLLKDDVGKNDTIESDKGLNPDAIYRLENSGYVKRGLLGLNLTKKGKLAYYSIFNGLEKESREVFYLLKRLYKAPEQDIVSVYKLYIQQNEKKDKS